MSKVKEISGKVKYHAQYLGWKESPFPYGTEVVNPLLVELTTRARQSSPDILPQLKISVDRKEIKLGHVVVGKRGKKEKVSLPTVAIKDLLFTTIGSDEETLTSVACIYYGFQPSTGCLMHVHVYRFETAKAASAFHRHLGQFIVTAQHRDRMSQLESQMIALVSGSAPAQLSPDSQIGSGVVSGKPGSKPEDENIDSMHAFYCVGGLIPPADYPKRLSGKGNDSTLGTEMKLPRAQLLLESGYSCVETNKLSESPHLRRYSPSEFGDDASRQRNSLPVFPPESGVHTSTGTQLNQFRMSATVNNIGNHSPSRPRSNASTPTPDWNTVPADPYAAEDARTADFPKPAVIPPVISSLTEELRGKFGRGPILLPPKDYDTVNRTRGTLIGIETRKCLNEDIVGRMDRPSSSSMSDQPVRSSIPDGEIQWVASP